MSLTGDNDWCQRCGDRAEIVDEEDDICLCDDCATDFIIEVYQGKNPYYEMDAEGKAKVEEMLEDDE